MDRNEKLKNMSFEKLYGCLVEKVQRKGRTRTEVDMVTVWLTGYTSQQIDEMMSDGTTYGAFIDHAPAWNPLFIQIKGRICNVRVEESQLPGNELPGLRRMI